MKFRWLPPALAAAGLVVSLSGVSSGEKPAPDSEASRIQRGFQIAPVRLSLRHLDRNLVGLGSYIVNAQAACNDCHTEPPYSVEADPREGWPEHLNDAGYLAGGRHFGDFVSPNITPDAQGLPAGLTWPQFKDTLRNGHDPEPDNDADDLLQVMPWPVYSKMTDRDLRAVYEYLRAIPSLPDPQ